MNTPPLATARSFGRVLLLQRWGKMYVWFVKDETKRQHAYDFETDICGHSVEDAIAKAAKRWPDFKLEGE